MHIRGIRALAPRTKGELFARCGWTLARIMIQRHAVRAFRRGGGGRICRVCQYAKHAEVCHIRAVADFPGEATLAEINVPENLVALCPNHHWELDHGLLKLTP